MSMDLDRRLRKALCEHPRRYDNRYTTNARNNFLETLFRSLTNDREDYLRTLFPNGFPASYKLKEVQGVQDDAEYTEAARGHPCGHIFKHGEASYNCATCTDDSTAVLCARCFVASDHEGHQFHISQSAGNSGCCDCGDEEAWKRPVHCAIHTSTDDFMRAEADVSALPQDLQDSIRTTIARALDYFCDVISCSPENLRTPKTTDSVQQDESCSRLMQGKYETDDDVETNPEFCLVLWNDEKHTITEVRDQVSRACRERERFGAAKAKEANDHGRSVVRHSRDLTELLRMSKVIEEIKITVTIRSSRDTFREEMCETIIDWLGDIAACSIGGDGHILRRFICEEMLHLWRVGSQAWNAKVGRIQLDDHEFEVNEDLNRDERDEGPRFNDPIQVLIERVVEDAEEGDNDMTGDEDIDIADDDDRGESADEGEYEILDDDNTETHVVLDHSTDAETAYDADEMDTDGDNDFSDANDRMDVENSIPPPPPPQIAPGEAPEPTIAANTETLSRQESESISEDQNRNYHVIPRTPTVHGRSSRHTPNHWTVTQVSTASPQPNVPIYENLHKNIRVDSLILFDLRLWKSVRVNLRDLLITTVINIPHFKRILGLRFSGLYTTLAQLYLIADREPDHSIINLSLQLLTTPSITEEVVEKGNFLTVLMAILYTFLTTRQVGFPADVDPEAVLGFDAGSVANRRLQHFFSDLRYLLMSPFVQARIRLEKQYLFQYLDLAKLSQGICPNVRAVGEHVEYETDAWISASLLTREINKLCRQFAEAFQIPVTQVDMKALADSSSHAIMHTTRAAIINSIGLEHQRFEQSEIRDIVKFHVMGPYQFDQHTTFKVVQFAVEKGTLSFHHPLHYMLSWLLEGGKHSVTSLHALREAAEGVVSSLHDNNVKIRGSHLQSIYVDGEDVLLALFDYPLRVCAWLAQMKANMWVRNGMSLRHQMSQYKNVTLRDLGYHRDLFLLQTALVACHPGRVLASMIDRYGLQSWLCGQYTTLSECEEVQMLDLAEELIYLLINLLSDRDALLAGHGDPEPQLTTLRKDIAHTLCFKPLSFSDLAARLTERAQEHEQLQEVLESMTTYRPPEGLHDTGLYELKQSYLEELDPYNSHFSKNQRDEAENVYKTWKAKMVNKPIDDIVLEPKLHTIRSEAYTDLCAVIHEPLFANTIYTLLRYVVRAKELAASVSTTRVEAFLQVLLHLTLIATLEDKGAYTETEADRSTFISYALKLDMEDGSSGTSSIVDMLHRIWALDEFSSSRSKIRYILRIFKQKHPSTFMNITRQLNFPSDRFDTASPAPDESEIEAKKKQALERKAKIMAQMQQQQQSFMDKQGVVDWGEEDLSDVEAEVTSPTEKRLWRFPTGVCIQCREETNDSRLYGTFAMVTDDHILRQTPVHDKDFLHEACSMPENLDYSIEEQRPFGVSGSNHEQIKRLASDGTEVFYDRQGLGKGWPNGWTEKGPVSTSCGHIMHFACFENYYQSIARRHTHQIARNHPERKDLKEFVCPLCKALANIFLPIVWRSTEQSYPGPLNTGTSFHIFMDYALPTALTHSGITDVEDDSAEKKLHVDTMLSYNAAAMAPFIHLATSRDDYPAKSDEQSWVDFATQSGATAYAELAAAYKRLTESMAIVRKTQLLKPEGATEHKPNQFEPLLETLANSIAVVEIAYRGRDSEYGSSILGSIPATTLSHLQVLSSTINAYAANRAWNKQADFGAEYRHEFACLLKRLLGSPSEASLKFKPAVPALQVDGFKLFTQSAMTICRLQQFPVHHLMRICLTLELVRVAASFLWDPNTCFREIPDQPGEKPTSQSEDLNAVSLLLTFMERNLHSSVPEDTTMPRSATSLRIIAAAMRNYALVFLRKSAILLHVACKLDLPTTTIGADASQPELDRLTRLLQMPNIFSILAEFSEYSARYTLHKLARHWIQDCVIYKTHDNGHVTAGLQPIRLLHPAPLELIGLPKYFDVLIDESHKRRCPTTGKELTDPALCLFCGEIFCAQAVCCMKDANQGGCNVHVQKCSFPIGLFLLIRRCFVVLLHVVKNPAKIDEDHAEQDQRSPGAPARDAAISYGSFFQAPYLTKHGETDSGLRSKHQLILNQKRYDRLLRDTWLMVNGSVWSTVARKLEGEVNAGGWETL